jgi:hypothetical protein
MDRRRVNAQMREIQRLFNKRNLSGKAVGMFAKIPRNGLFAILKSRFYIPGEEFRCKIREMRAEKRCAAK